MLTYDNNRPMYIQVLDDLKKQIVKKQYKANDKFPSSRELAIEYGINPNTAARVYREMELLGLCYTKKGLGTYLLEEKDMVVNLKQSMANKILDDFIKNMTELGYEKEEIIKQINKRGSELK